MLSTCVPYPLNLSVIYDIMRICLLFGVFCTSTSTFIISIRTCVFMLYSIQLDRSLELISFESENISIGVTLKRLHTVCTTGGERVDDTDNPCNKHI